MRAFNYLNSSTELCSVYNIVHKIMNNILLLDDTLLDNNDKVKLGKIKEEIKKIKLDDYSFMNKKINSDLLSVENVEYATKYGFYPDHASLYGEQVNKLFERIFELEDEVQILVAKIWQKLLTPFDKIVNGDNICVVGHSGNGYIPLPGSSQYKDSPYFNTVSYSCSLFTNYSMNCFSSKLILLFDITPESFVAASSIDSATTKSTTRVNYNTLKRYDDGQALNAGYSLVGQRQDMIITKVENPIDILKTINTRDKTSNKNFINETILDKRSAKPTGLLLISDGYDFLLDLYIDALQMEADYNLRLKVINKGLYREKIGKPNVTRENLVELKKQLERFETTLFGLNIPINSKIGILEGYINDVVIPLRLDPFIRDLQIEFINDLIMKLKENQSLYS